MPNPKAFIRTAAYRSGILGIVHRIRNRNTLTVFMFHRVLPADSDAYTHSEREYTFTDKGFGQCLDFICKHYNVINLAQLRAHTETIAGLPRRAGLITFDDGWRDTLLYALPELRKHGVPAVLFLATSVIDAKGARWWHDLVSTTTKTLDGLRKVESSLGISIAPNDSHRDRIYRVIKTVGEMPNNARHRFLQSWDTFHLTERQMLTRDDVHRLDTIKVAGHGHSHIALTALPDPLTDLAHSRIVLKEIGAETDVMSFPHGATNEMVRALAHQAGFRICFDSRPVLMNTRRQWISDIGRVHIPQNEWTSNRSGVDRAKLATFLFFRPHAI